MMPLEIGWSATVMWTAGDALCRIFSFFRIFGLFLSGNILICISFDRFYAIVCPLATGSAKRINRILLASAWILATLSASPQLYIFHVEAHPNFPWYTQCVTFNSFPSPVYETAYTVFGMIMMYVVPLAAIIFTYTIILVTIYKKSKMSTAGGKLNFEDVLKKVFCSESHHRHYARIFSAGKLFFLLSTFEEKDQQFVSWGNFFAVF